MQNKKTSLIESITNTVTGFLLSLLLAPVIFQICNVSTTFLQNIQTTLLFAFVSIIRGYIVRRYFNKQEN